MLSESQLSGCVYLVMVMAPWMIAFLVTPEEKTKRIENVL